MVGSQHLLLHEQSHSVQFLHPSMEVNVNGIGKGYTLDCCRRLLLDQGVADFLLQGGTQQCSRRRSAGKASASPRPGGKSPCATRAARTSEFSNSIYWTPLWERLGRRRTHSIIAASATAIFSTRVQAGPPRACCPPLSWHPTPQSPTHCQRRFMSWAPKQLWPCARPGRNWRRF